MPTKELSFNKEYEKFIAASISGKRLTASGKKLTKGAIQNYQHTYKLLQDFQALQQIELRFVLLNKASLIQIQKEKNYWLKFFRKFSNFLYKQKDCYDNYVNAVFKNIKTFFNYLLVDKALPIGSYHKLFKLPQQNIAPIVISPQQLNFLIVDSAFYNTLTPSLQRIRDIFIIGCTIGLRVSDLMLIKQNNLIKTNNEYYLHLHTKKTGTELNIPLPSYVVEIFNKYKTKNSNYLLPRIANVNINKKVKELAEKAGWTNQIPKNKTKQGKIIEQSNKKNKGYRFCDHITSHTMRRTAITTLLILGVPELVVRKISGHAAGSKEFFKYVHIANEYTNQHVKEAHQKLLDFNKKSTNIEI